MAVTPRWIKYNLPSTTRRGEIRSGSVGERNSSVEQVQRSAPELLGTGKCRGNWKPISMRQSLGLSCLVFEKEWRTPSGDDWEEYAAEDKRSDVQRLDEKQWSQKRAWRGKSNTTNTNVKTAMVWSWEEARWVKRAMEMEVDGRGLRWRPSLKWRENVRSETKMRGVVPSLHPRMLSRSRWIYSLITFRFIKIVLLFFASPPRQSTRGILSPSDVMGGEWRYDLGKSESLLIIPKAINRPGRFAFAAGNVW